MIVEEAIMMVVAMMDVEKVNEEKEALALAIKKTIGEIKNWGQRRSSSL